MNIEVKGRNVYIRYVIYETFKKFSDGEMVIKPVYLQKDSGNWFGEEIQNSFDTEEEAIEALIEADKRFEDFLIIKTVHVDY